MREMDMPEKNLRNRNCKTKTDHLVRLMMASILGLIAAAGTEQAAHAGEAGVERGHISRQDRLERIAQRREFQQLRQ
jgi:hypothetical protein